MLFEIHMLKNYAPSNLNRDDVGAPKSCSFGGVQRGRISSQCLKHSWRNSQIFQESVGKAELGIRTRHLPEMVMDELAGSDIPEEYLEIIKKKITGFGNKDGKENAKGDYTAQIVFYTPEDVSAVAETIKERLMQCHTKDEVKKISAKDIQADMKEGNMRGITLDMALFGRMVTSDAFADIEASMQVAHAISTNRILPESDFFTAVDDLLSESEETGSGMMGDVDYNSSCYYIYAALDTDKLRENLAKTDTRDELMAKVLPLLLETIAFTNPSGKQNSFAAHSLPSAIMIECKEKKVPVSYANAFEKPVYAAGEKTLSSRSAQQLLDFEDKMKKAYGLPVTKRLWFTTEEVKVADEEIVVCDTFQEMLAQLPKA